MKVFVLIADSRVRVCADRARALQIWRRFRRMFPAARMEPVGSEVKP